MTTEPSGTCQWVGPDTDGEAEGCVNPVDPRHGRLCTPHARDEFEAMQGVVKHVLNAGDASLRDALLGEGATDARAETTAAYVVPDSPDDEVIEPLPTRELEAPYPVIPIDTGHVDAHNALHDRHNHLIDWEPKVERDLHAVRAHVAAVEDAMLRSNVDLGARIDELDESLTGVECALWVTAGLFFVVLVIALLSVFVG